MFWIHPLAQTVLSAVSFHWQQELAASVLLAELNSLAVVHSHGEWRPSAYQTPLEIMLIWHDCALPDFIKRTLICHGHLHHNTVIDGSLLVL